MATYKVVDTREVSTLSPTGNEVKFYRVWLRTEHGASGSVDVGETQWNAETLPGILEEKAAALDLAFSLTG